MNYYYEKNFLKLKDIAFAQVFFDNGDYFTLNKNEIIDFEFEFYDRMIWFNNCVVPVAKKGYVKFKISKYKSSRYDSSYMNSIKEYNRDRKEYIEYKFCNDVGIVNLRFFNNSNWHKSVSGQFIGKMENDYLVLSVIDVWPNISSSNDNYSISLHSINKNNIDSIDFVLENFESFEIFKTGIIDVNINLSEKLYESSGDYQRKIIDGIIKIKIDSKSILRSFFPDNEIEKEKKIKERLLNKKKKLSHDICRLNINYDYASFGMKRVESLEIEGKWENIESDEYFAEFIGGYCELLENDIIAIYFNKFLDEKSNIK